MDICLDFVFDGEFNHTDAERMLFFLVSRGGQYNSGESRGHYSIVGDNVNEEVHKTEGTEGPNTEKLADILEKYRSFNPKRTSLGISLSYLADPGISIQIVFIPISISDEEVTTIVRLETSEQQVDSETTYKEFIKLADALCRRFSFMYGAYRSEHDASIPLQEDEILITDIKPVVYYSPQIADKIGRERLLSAPATTVIQHDDGGVFLIACYDCYGGCEELSAIKAHLGL